MCFLCPVVGRSRPAVVACCTVRSGVFHHWIQHLWPQGAILPAFNPLRRGWVYRPAPEKGEFRRGPRHFLELHDTCGLRPCDRTHLKNGLTLVGCRINTARSLRCIVSSGRTLWTGCGCVLHGSFGCVPPLGTTPLASGSRPPRLQPSAAGLGLSPGA